MRVGDLVKCTINYHNFGIGLLVRKLDGQRARICWAVLWTNPMWIMEDGCSVMYEAELEAIGESR